MLPMDSKSMSGEAEVMKRGNCDGLSCEYSATLRLGWSVSHNKQLPKYEGQSLKTQCIDACFFTFMKPLPHFRQKVRCI